MIQTRRLFMAHGGCCEPAAISTKILQVVPRAPPFLVHRGQADQRQTGFRCDAAQTESFPEGARRAE